MAERRPAVFIGSSAEGLKFAKAIQQNLDHACDATIWSQGVFGLGGGTLETLVDTAPEFDFAILLLTPDDITLSREQQQASPRDNVLLELGLFIGVLGRKRTFCVYDREAKPKLPSDLAGVSTAQYQPHANGNFQASVGAACTEIENSIRSLGLRKRPADVFDVDNNTQFQVIWGLLDDQTAGFFVLMNEMNVKLRKEPSVGQGTVYVFRAGGRYGSGDFSVRTLCHKLADADLLSIDLRDNVSLTDRGRQFAQWLTENGHKPDFFKTSLGQWGVDDGKYKDPRLP